jgi:hypothetical protein
MCSRFGLLAVYTELQLQRLWISSMMSHCRVKHMNEQLKGPNEHRLGKVQWLLCDRASFLASPLGQPWAFVHLCQKGRRRRRNATLQHPLLNCSSSTWIISALVSQEKENLLIKYSCSWTTHYNSSQPVGKKITRALISDFTTEIISGLSDLHEFLSIT